jgi:hypothetical protein
VRSPRIAIVILALGCDKSNDAPQITSTPPPPASSPAPVASAPPPVDPFANTGPVMREQKDVVVDGVTEKWRLEWTKPPVPNCTEQALWETCACAGFAFGEKGDLDLVRSRPGTPDERLHLGPLFDDHDARLRRWATSKADSGKQPNIADLSMRPLAPVMKIADYDHDARATEMVLQVGASACGHTPTLLVGISKSNPKLHAFASTDKPSEPLTLDHPDDWEKLRQKPTVDLVQLACGDHGAEEETSVHLVADGELHAKETTKKCP